MTWVLLEAGRVYRVSSRFSFTSQESTMPYSFSVLGFPILSGRRTAPPVGRPPRGKRSKVKAGRRAARQK